MGDFNFSDIDWINSCTTNNANTDCKEFFQCIEDHFLTQHVSTPTRSQSLLDLVFTGDPDIISQSEVIENLGTSDHNMVTFQLHHDCHVFDTKREYRDYCRGNYSAIRNKLRSIEWDNFMSHDKLTCWHKLKEFLLRLEEKFIPMRKCSKNGVKKPVWMTQKALRYVKRKHRIFKKYKCKDHPAVKAANKAAENEVRKAKLNFERKLASNIKHDRNLFCLCQK